MSKKIVNSQALKTQRLHLRRKVKNLRLDEDEEIEWRDVLACQYYNYMLFHSDKCDCGHLWERVYDQEELWKGSDFKGLWETMVTAIDIGLSEDEFVKLLKKFHPYWFEVVGLQFEYDKKSLEKLIENHWG